MGYRNLHYFGMRNNNNEYPAQDLNGKTQLIMRETPTGKDRKDFIKTTEEL